MKTPEIKTYLNLDWFLFTHSKLHPLEAMLYQYCFRFYLNCKKDKKPFYVDQLVVAQFLRCTRKTVAKYIAALERIGLLIRTGVTSQKQIIYTVNDWETMLDEVIMNDAEYKEFTNKYQDERQRNKAAFEIAFPVVETEEATQGSTEPTEPQKDVGLVLLPIEPKTSENSAQAVIEPIPELALTDMQIESYCSLNLNR